MTYPTCRRYPRTVAEAWPREHANPITFYPAPAVRIRRALVCFAAAAAIGAIAEKPEALGRSLIFVGLAEGVAIYGLLIAFLVLFG